MFIKKLMRFKNKLCCDRKFFPIFSFYVFFQFLLQRATSGIVKPFKERGLTLIRATSSAFKNEKPTFFASPLRRL